MAAGPVVGGTLSWGVSSAFASYVTGPIAHGQITTSGAARTSGGFAFPIRSGQGSGDALDVRSTGSVRFTGHDQGDGPLLDLTVSSPRLVVDGSGGRLFVDVRSKRLDDGSTYAASGVLFATVAATSGSLAGEDGSVSLAAADATLTSAGAAAFAGYYRAGEPMSAVAVDAGLCEGAAPTAAATSSSTGEGSTKRMTDKAKRDQDTDPSRAAAVTTDELEAAVDGSAVTEDIATVASVGARSELATVGWLALGALIVIGAFAAGRGAAGRRPTGGSDA